MCKVFTCLQHLQIIHCWRCHDMMSHVKDHLPEQPVRPSGEQLVVPSPPEHEGNLKHISKNWVQYVPVKQKNIQF